MMEVPPPFDAYVKKDKSFSVVGKVIGGVLFDDPRYTKAYARYIPVIEVESIKISGK